MKRIRSEKKKKNSSEPRNQCSSSSVLPGDSEGSSLIVADTDYVEREGVSEKTKRNGDRVGIEKAGLGVEDEWGKIGTRTWH